MLVILSPGTSGHIRDVCRHSWAGEQQVESGDAAPTLGASDVPTTGDDVSSLVCSSAKSVFPIPSAALWLVLLSAWRQPRLLPLSLPPLSWACLRIRASGLAETGCPPIHGPLPLLPVLRESSLAKISTVPRIKHISCSLTQSSGITPTAVPLSVCPGPG